MINGIVNINKEAGFTSHDVVAKLRGITKQRKIGHTGTLDPDAKGVLPVCFGKATKVCELLTNKDKVYVTTLLFGKVTDTQDSSGIVIGEYDISELLEEEIKKCIMSFVGEYMQIPPMYSALKVKGKKLYELARKGVEIERTHRKVIINYINILEIDLPCVKMEVSCSKGTYIRTLCHDIGNKLKCGGIMENLLRTKVGDFTLEESITIDQFKNIFSKGQLDDVLLKVDEIFHDYPRKTILEGEERLAYNGNAIPFDIIVEEADIINGDKVRLYDINNDFIGIYKYYDGKFCVEKMFYERA